MEFMWVARRRCKTFALNLSGANLFSILFIFFFASSFWVQLFYARLGEEWGGGLGKQKDFAAKANGFLVSCYYFIWPEPGDSDNCNFSRAIVASILQLL